MDCIKIKNLEVFANHGVFKEEKSLGQKFILSLSVYFDQSRAAKTDDLNYSINYGQLCFEILERYKEKSFDLIESSCLDIIDFIFAKYKMVEKIDLEVKKPWAPVHTAVDMISIKMSRKRRNFYIGIGTNMGQKEENIAQAIELMKENGLDIVKESDLLKNKAWGKTDQDDFVNKIVVANSYEEPEELLTILNKIEDEMGRKRLVKWGPRIIDLDILFVDYEKIYTDRLIVPHPYIQDRSFILEQLVEIAPHFVHPILNKTVSALYEELKEKELK